MASSLLTTERRWAAPPARKSGMTVLGKVPKPINLPSQRLENNGLDPNLEIVPKGTLTWGSKPTPAAPNAWGSSSFLSTKNDGGSSSSSHFNGRPSSGGGSRPSTAGSESLCSPNAWGPNSRPSSASGTLPSPHLPMATNRPRSADRPQSAETRPGSSQLSRFAENASENVKASLRTIDRSGSSSHGHGFTLSTGDFPTLGSEKCTESNSQRAHSSKGRPTSSSGKETSQNEQEKMLTSGSVEVISPSNNQSVDIMKTEKHAHAGVAPFSTTSMPNEVQQPQPHPINFRMPPPQFDSWHAPPGQPHEGMWHRGAAPGGPFRPVGPGAFPIEPFGYYGQFPPNSEAASRQGSGHGGYHPKNGDSYHPIRPNSYMMNQPVIAVRPAFQGPGPYDGYYGCRANFNFINGRDPHFVGGPHQPGILNHFPNQNDKFNPEHSQSRSGKHEAVPPREQLESDKVHVFHQGQPRILHDNPDRLGGTHEVERSAQTAAPLLPYPDGNRTDVNMRTGIRDTFGERNKVLTKSAPDQRGPAGIDCSSVFGNAHSYPREIGDGSLRKKLKEDNSVTLDQQQPVIKKNAALIEKIESLNNKARNVDARNIPEPASSKELKDKQQKSTDSKADQVMRDVSSTAVIAGVDSASDKAASVSHVSPLLQRQPNVPTDGTVVGPSHSQLSEFSKVGKRGDSISDRGHRRGDSSRNSHHGPAKDRSANKLGHEQGESYTSDSLPVLDLRNSQHDQLPGSASQLPAVTVTDDMLASLDYESQRAKMRELAAQRAKKLQAEEEERIKNQKAKALAKLEELNRRSIQKKSSDTTVESADTQNRQKDGLDVTTKPATSTAELRDVTASESLTTLLPPNDPMHTAVPVQPQSAASHAAGVGKDHVAHAVSSLARNTQSDKEHVAQKSISQSHDISVPKPRQGYRKRHVISEEKIPGEKPSITVSTGNAKKNIEVSLDTAAAVVTSHDDPPAQNKKGGRHSKSKKKVDDGPITSKHPPVVFTEQNTVKVSSEPKTQTGGVIISSSIVPTEGTIVTVGSITVGGISLAPLNQERVKSPNGIHNTENSRSRPQQARRSGKQQHVVRPGEKPRGNEGVLWAPVKPPGQNGQCDGSVLNAAVADSTQVPGNNLNDVENITRTKRAEMERYVPKPLSKELQQQNLGQDSEAEKTYADSKSHGKEAVENSSDAKFNAASEPKKWEDKKTSKGHGKSHPSWRRRNADESAFVVPNPFEQAGNSDESKKVQKSSDYNQPVEPDNQEDKRFKPKATAPADNCSVPAQTDPLPVSASKEHNAANRPRRQPAKSQRKEARSHSNESKDKEGRSDFVQPAAPHMDSHSNDHRNMPRPDVKNSGVVSQSRAHWKPKSNPHSQNSTDGTSVVEGQVDSHGATCQDVNRKSIKMSDGIDEKDAHGEQENLTREDGNQKSETRISGEHQQANPSLRRQGQHNARYQRGGGTHRGRGYDAGRPNHGTNAERRRGGSHLEYQPVGSYNRATDFQQNPSVDERTEGPPASGPVFRERGHNKGPRPAGHFVRRNPASASTTSSYPEE